MLMPKRVKHRKVQRGRMRGNSKGGHQVAFGEYGLSLRQRQDHVAVRTDAQLVTSFDVLDQGTRIRHAVNDVIIRPRKDTGGGLKRC